MEFDWDKYLKANKSIVVPEELFSHVESSVKNGINQCTWLEVCYKTNPDIYWIAEITMVCGPLLRLKFLGGTEDFWVNISTEKVHQLGWCGKYDELLKPPTAIYSRYGDAVIDIMKNKALLNRQSISIEAINNKGLSPIDRIKAGMKVEIQNDLDPYKYWIATVIENIGGRLLLHYDGSNKDMQELWAFYTNPRLYNFGYVTSKGCPWQLQYPDKINNFSCKNKLSIQLRKSAEESIKEPTPADLFQPASSLEVHNFVTGMKVEALNPNDMMTVRPATVTKVFNDFHFLVVIDDHLDEYEDSKMAWLCDSMHPYIFPIGWAKKHSINFKAPKVWKDRTFDWDDYLSMTSSIPAPDYCFGVKAPIKGFELKMKLEAVNPQNQKEIHVATIYSIVEHMVCVELLPIGKKFWYAQNSDSLFPVGWCESNNYALHTPVVSVKKKELPKPIEEIRNAEECIKSSVEWCDSIFFNYKCYSGPSISRNKLSQLPKHVGPGPLSLVLQEVLNKIISASYKPTKILKDLKSKGPPAKGMRLEVLRAKVKSKAHHAYVPLATSKEQVSSFCREVCVQLQACPSLFGPEEHRDQCPYNCRNVDKSSFYHNTEHIDRRKSSLNGNRKKKMTKQQKNNKRPQPSQETENNKDESTSENSAGSILPSEAGTRSNSSDSGIELKGIQRRKREPKTSYPKMEMKTRGAKLPNFAQQMKEGHWNKKDMETIYSSKYIGKKRNLLDTDSENGTSSTNSTDAKNISGMSDSDEPEVKKLKFSLSDPLPSDMVFEKNNNDWMTGKLKLSPNPLDWSVDDVYAYMKNTKDCESVAEKMKQEEIDGEAFLMLDLQIIQEFLHMKEKYAVLLYKHIAKIRYYYLVNFEYNNIST